MYFKRGSTLVFKAILQKNVKSSFRLIKIYTIGKTVGIKTDIEYTK